MKVPQFRNVPSQPADYDLDAPSRHKVRRIERDLLAKVERVSRHIEAKARVDAWLWFLVGLTLGCTIMAMVRGIT